MAPNMIALTGRSANSTKPGAGYPWQLRAAGIRKAFGGQTVLDGISLELQRGEVVLLRGANGSGKTTLLNVLTGNLVPDAGEIHLLTNGSSEYFRFPAKWWRTLNPFDHFSPERVCREGLGRSWQDIRLFPTLTLQDNIAVATPAQAMENPIWALLRPSRSTKREKQNLTAARKVLAELGLAGREMSSGDKVSLGQSKRVAIARAVQAGARVLFLDEPLAGLDANGVSEIMGLLRKLAQDEKMTLVIVEHVMNIRRIVDLATTVWTLKDGKLEVKNVGKKATVHRASNGHDLQSWAAELTGMRADVKNQRLPGGAILSTIAPSQDRQGEIVLKVEDLVVHRGRRLVIGIHGEDGQHRGLSFALRRGDLAILQAPNGWGKTTLLEALAGLIRPTYGRIELSGREIQGQTPWECAQAGLSLLQARDHVFPSLTVREAFRLTHVTSIPEGLTHLLNKRMSSLSGGEKQSVATACATNSGAFSVALLDEPLSALDMASLRSFGSSLRNHLKDAAVLIAVPGSLGELG